MQSKYRIAYASRLTYPDKAANALQTIHMASAFAQQTEDAHLFVADLKEPKEQVLRQYSVAQSPLKIWSLHYRKWLPLVYPVIRQSPWMRVKVHNSAIAAILKLNPVWRHSKGRQNVLFVRGNMDTIYWGLMRRYLRQLDDWVYVYEVHDMMIAEGGDRTDRSPLRPTRVLRALLNFDVMTTVSRGIAEDMAEFTSGKARPLVVPQATNMPRLSSYSPPCKDRGINRIVLGYVGTIDRMRGVDHVLQAMRYLPDRFHLQIVGRALREEDDGGADPGWLTRLLDEPDIGRKVELVGSVPYSEVVTQIDMCDIVIQPAGLNQMFSRYAAPLKLFDYMARGKPIVAADVPCHAEALKEGFNCVTYRAGDPADLAKRIMSLADNPWLTRSIGRMAWKESEDHTYDSRAKRILEHVDEAFERKGRIRDA